MAEHIDYDKESEDRYAAVNKTGGPAQGGLTVRDYFAAKAMAAYLADTDLNWSNNCAKNAARNAYWIADAMMEERSK